MRETIWQEFSHSFAIHSRRTAIRMEESEFTYRELDAWSAAVARQLSQLGVDKGDAVALFTRNCVEFIVCDVAVARLGAVKVPINHMLPVSTAKYIVESSGARAIVFSPELCTNDEIMEFASPIRIACAPKGGKSVPEAVVLASPPPSNVYEGFGDGADGGTSLAAIYFTGGTTGKPKGVVHDQSSTVANHYAQMLEAEITDSDRLLLMTPLAHSAGLFAQSALIRGATIVLTDGFEASAASSLMVNEKITWTFLVPTMIYRLLDVLDETSMASTRLRTVVYGAAPISPKRLQQALEAWGPVLIQLYGQTECPNWGTKLSKLDHDLERPHLLTSCGQPSIMVDVQVVDDSGSPLGTGETGEICLRSPYTLKEYLNDEDSTREKFIGEWIRTGDIGMMDADGYLYLKDRKNDMIVTGGMNVYCREVEDALSQHPLVRTVAVIGIPHADWGESVHAVVVRSDDDLSETDLIAWARARLSAYATPKTVEFVGTLPETPFGKIDKKTLRFPYWENHWRSIG